MHCTPFPWQDPLATARSINTREENFIFLYSSLTNNSNTTYSLLAYHPKKNIQGTAWHELASQLSTDKEPFSNAWFGYLSYELKHQLETLPIDKSNTITLPALWFTQYHHILVFNHTAHHCLLYSDTTNPVLPSETMEEPSSWQAPEIAILQSNMDKKSYLAKVTAILAAIKKGDIYQANLTRKFFGRFANRVNSFALFSNLCHISPASYSCFLKLGPSQILSSSPEQFLHLTPQGKIISCPIKGSSPRYPDQGKDAQSRSGLQQSTKNRAENLMIVDLIRNDLAKGSIPGSVKVEKLWEIASYNTIHHMYSKISAQRYPHLAPLEIIKNCFPPGSMTGAPKIKAMEICSRHEQHQRGVYSGALGWFGGDGSADLSVVIRTLILHNNQFEFQVGGGIVADSQPEEEWHETLIKATALAQILGINPHKDLAF